MNLFATNIVVLEHKPSPLPISVSAMQINNGTLSNQLVCVKGVLSRALRDSFDPYFNWIILRTSDGTVRAAISEMNYPLSRLQGLIDAEVSLLGIVRRFKAWRSPLGYFIILNSTHPISCTRESPSPFSAPHLTDSPSLHRQQATGHVIATSRGIVYLSSPNHAFLPVKCADAETQALPRPGQSVTAAGFVEINQIYQELTDAIIRINNDQCRQNTNTPPINLHDIFSSPIFDEKLFVELINGKIVHLRGTVLTPPENLGNPDVIQVGGTDWSIDVDLYGVRKNIPESISAGYTVDITGLMVTEMENDELSYVLPQFKRYLVIPRTTDDFKIVKRPSRLTPKVLLAIIMILFATILGVVAWNGSLRKLSRRRAHELYRETIKHTLAEQKVEERTRLAVELHDSLSQTLTGVALQIDSAGRAGGNDSPLISRFLDNARQMLSSCRQELQCCLWDLRVRTFEEKNMTEAVERTIAPHLGDATATVRFNVPRQLLSESTTHTILRIIRELTVNAIRHGQAKALKIAGNFEDGVIRFSVTDDGTGFTPENAPGPLQGHFGLQGIRERLSSCNGSLEIASKPARGTRIRITMNTTCD